MNISPRVLLVLLLIGFGARGASADDMQTLELTVDGAARTALVHAPAKPANGGSPLVFVFHGHGGNSRNVVNSFGIERLWPEAIVVYPQGLNAPGSKTDPEGVRPGWQKAGGDQGDRDLHFFDALLARVKKDHPVDDKRIYATGHSNGAGFTYLLWLERPQVFAAVAPSSGGAPFAAKLTPKPAMILAAKDDEVVRFESQERIIDDVRSVNGCSATDKPWAGGATIYDSKGGTPLVTYIHQGGHRFDRAMPALMVKFFQEHPGAAKTATR